MLLIFCSYICAFLYWLLGTLENQLFVWQDWDPACLEAKLKLNLWACFLWGIKVSSCTGTEIFLFKNNFREIIHVLYLSLKAFECSSERRKLLLNKVRNGLVCCITKLLYLSTCIYVVLFTSCSKEKRNLLPGIPNTSLFVLTLLNFSPQRNSS